MEALETARHVMGLSIGAVEKRSGISFSSFYSWRSQRRNPTLCNLRALAESLGYRVVLETSPGSWIDMAQQREALMAIEKARLARGMNVHVLEEVSGVSFSAFYSWRCGQRSPMMANAIALANTFDFRILMVREAGT